MTVELIARALPGGSALASNLDTARLILASLRDAAIDPDDLLVALRKAEAERDTLVQQRDGYAREADRLLTDIAAAKMQLAEAHPAVAAHEKSTTFLESVLAGQIPDLDHARQIVAEARALDPVPAGVYAAHG